MVASLFDDGQEVAKDLAGMDQVGQSVDDRNR